MTKLLSLLAFVVMSCWFAWAANAAKELDAATQVVQNMASSNQIPSSLLKQAKCIAVIPKLTKAGLIVGGEHGGGVMSCRTASGWSGPAFITITGGSVGLQIGAAKTDFILLFMNDDAIGGLLKDKFEIGGEGSAVGGPVGRTAAASTDALLRAAIISYSRSKGLFAGLELKGVVIKADDDENQRVYATKARELLVPGSAMTLSKMPADVRVFPQTLARYSTK